MRNPLKAPDRQSFDPSTGTRTFRDDALWGYYSGVGLVIVSVGMTVFAALPFVTGSLGDRVFLLLFAVAGAFFGIRGLRLSVVVGPSGITAHNWFRSHSATRDQVLAVKLYPVSKGEAGMHWFPFVERTDGSKFQLSAFDCGRAWGNSTPEPKYLGWVDAIREMLGVSGVDV